MSPDVRVDDITESFRQRILNGDFGSFGRLPSLRLLAEELSTTRETMNKVVQHLQAEGLLISRGTAGVFVNLPRLRIPGVTERFDSFLESQGLTPVMVNVEGPSAIPVSPDLANMFGLVEGMLVVRRLRLQGTPSVYYRLAETFYPFDLVGEDVLKLMQSDSRFYVLGHIKEKHGKVIKHVHENLIARLPTLREQNLLKIVRGTPVVEVRRTSYAADDNTIIMFNRIIFVANYFDFSYDYATEHWIRN